MISSECSYFGSHVEVDQMTLAELSVDLQRLQIPADSYCLQGGLPDEAYCIESQSDGRWAVYYSERGVKSGLLTFSNEEEACSYLLQEISKVFGYRV